VPALLEIVDLVVEFTTPTGMVQAVNGASYDVAAGEIVAVVGESGSGKSVTALSVLRLIPEPPGRIVSGSIRFLGEDLLSLDEEAVRRLRGRRIAMIFQEPMTSLNPVLSIGRQLTEAMRLHLELNAEAARARAVELLGLVGISEPERRLKQYPHHLSGGMRQRVMIAMAMSCEPELIIADEPTTALDVTIQAQILELMQGLCRRLGVALVIITHNLGIVARYADNVYRRPSHPYTVGLLNSVPRLDRPRGSPLDPIPGNPPDLSALPAGCAFRPRCTFAVKRCAEEVPTLRAVAEGHHSACFEFEKLHAEVTV
jgi:oligopeptide/dipeptide ABC transporter ATP-binding protein